MARRFSCLWLFAFILVALPPGATAQETVERTLNVSGGWIGYPGYLHINLPYRFTIDPPGAARVSGQPTFEAFVGLPMDAGAGARFAYGSPVVPGNPDEWEVFARYRPLTEEQVGLFDVAVTAAYNGAASSIDGELSVARDVGPLRLLGAGRTFSAAYGSGDARFAAAVGAVLHPLRGRFPIALAGDVGSLIDREGGESLAWSAGVQLGLSFTPHTLSLFATNTRTGTLQGVSVGDDEVRFGFELTIPIPAGRFLGAFVPREQAMEAVTEEPTEARDVTIVQVRDYLFGPKRLVIDAGTTVEWVNMDEVVHTATAQDGSWDSGGIPPGSSWRARFDRPGIYPYFCSPHPFMIGVIVVR